MSERGVPSWSVAGWGDPVTGLPYRLRPVPGGDVGGTVVPVVAMARWPQSISTRLDIAESAIESSSYTVSVARIDELEAARDLRRFLWQSRPDRVAILVTSMGAVTTSMQVALEPGATLPGTPFTVYLEREAMRVTGVSGTGSLRTLTVERRCYGSTGFQHLGTPGADTEVYLANPIVVGREVVVYDYDPDSDTESVVWRGLLEEPRLEDGTGVMHLGARDTWGYLTERLVGEGRLTTRGEIVQAGPGLPGAMIYIAPGATVQRGNALYVPDPISGVTGIRGTVVTDGQVVAPAYIEEYGFSGWATRLLGGGDSPTLFGTVAEEASGSVGRGTSIHEVLIADPDSEWSMVRDAAGNRSAHPLVVLRNILCSSGTAYWPIPGSHTAGVNGDYDWLPVHWGAGIPDDLIAHDAIDAIMARDLYRDLEVRNLIIGADEKLPTLPEVMKRLLQPALLVPAYDEQMRFSVVGLHDPGAKADDVAVGVTDIVATGDSPVAIRAQPWSSMRRYRRVRMRAARIGVSDDHGEVILDSDVESRLRNRHPWGAPTLEVDAGDYGHPEHHELTLRDRVALEGVGALRLDAVRDRLPEYELPLRAGLPNLPAGRTIRLTLGVLVGDDGERRSVVNHRCLVIESERDSLTRVQRVRVLDLYPLTRAGEFVAPSWRIQSVSSNTLVTLLPNHYSADDTAWIIDNQNNATFDLYSADGVLRSVDGSVIGQIVSGTDLQLDDPWEDGGSPVTPVPGDVVEIQRYVNGSFPWDGFCWIADTDATLGTNDDPASRWGH